MPQSAMPPTQSIMHTDADTVSNVPQKECRFAFVISYVNGVEEKELRQTTNDPNSMKNKRVSAVGATTEWIWTRFLLILFLKWNTAI